MSFQADTSPLGHATVTMNIKEGFGVATLANVPLSKLTGKKTLRASYEGTQTILGSTSCIKL